MKTIFLCLLLVMSRSLLSQECRRSGQSLASDGWSKQLKFVCLDDGTPVNFFRSPDQRKVLIADRDGFRLRVDGKSVRWPEGKRICALSAGVSWSPSSSAFYLNDGQCGGLDGWALRVFRLTEGGVVANDAIRLESVRRFRAQLRCRRMAIDPNVWGIGWSSDGAQIFAFAQATVNESCGHQGDFRGIVGQLDGEPIIEFYSESEAQQHFHDILPYNMR